MIKLLTDLDKGEKGRIAEILSGIESSAGHRHGIAKHFDQTFLKFERQAKTPPNTEPRNVRRLKNLGVRVGNELKVISKQPFCLIVIEIDNREITKSPFFRPFHRLLTFLGLVQFPNLFRFIFYFPTILAFLSKTKHF